MFLCGTLAIEWEFAIKVLGGCFVTTGGEMIRKGNGLGGIRHHTET
jgi:hypothetical protein